MFPFRRRDGAEDLPEPPAGEGDPAGMPTPGERDERAHTPRRPWWRRLGGLAIEVAIIVGVAWAVPHALAFALRTDCPLATITSSSMWPTLKRGDLVVVKGIDESAVSVGDIVVYESGTGTMVIHRVITVDGQTLVTQGDANGEPDEPIALADVAGVVPVLGGAPLHLPYLGQITLLANGGM